MKGKKKRNVSKIMLPISLSPGLLDDLGGSRIDKLTTAGVTTLGELATVDSKDIAARIDGISESLLEKKKEEARNALREVGKCLETLQEKMGDALVLSQVDEALMEKTKESFVRRRSFHRQGELLNLGIQYEDIDKALGQFPENEQREKIDEVLDGARRRLAEDVHRQLEISGNNTSDEE